MSKQLHQSPYHIPVLLQPAVNMLITNPDGIYVDLTFGGGGHSREILNRLSENGKLYAFDQDDDAHSNAPDDCRFTLIKGNFRFFENYLRFHQTHQVSGVLADLGVSSHQFDEASRGFSFRFDAPLDMRMDKTQTLMAQHVINDYKEEQLADVLYLYGELKQSRQMAKEIVGNRKERKIITTNDLQNVLKKWTNTHGKNMMAQVFQALRIEVNQELDALKEMLYQTPSVIQPSGRLVIISYHSLEDRLVKNFIRSGNMEGHIKKDLFGNIIAPFKPLHLKAVMPDDDEICNNPRARSARLRTGERNNQPIEDNSKKQPIR